MKDVKEQGKFVTLPEGEYLMEITEKTDKESSNGDPMVLIKLSVYAGEFQDEAWVYDNILIPPLSSPSAKILGRTKHFLHCIGEPYEGEEVEWDSDNWVNRQVKVRIIHEQPNEYHKFVKPVIAEYILDEEIEQEEGPQL